MSGGIDQTPPMLRLPPNPSSEAGRHPAQETRQQYVTRVLPGIRLTRHCFKRDGKRRSSPVSNGVAGQPTCDLNLTFGVSADGRSKDGAETFNLDFRPAAGRPRAAVVSPAPPLCFEVGREFFGQDRLP